MNLEEIKARAEAAQRRVIFDQCTACPRDGGIEFWIEGSRDYWGEYDRDTIHHNRVSYTLACYVQVGPTVYACTRTADGN